MIKNKFKVRTKNKSVKRKPRYWILSVTAVGVLVAFTVGNSRAINIGYAKEKPSISLIEADKNEDIRGFDIAAGTLDEVLVAFEKVTGWRVEIPANIKDIASLGVKGDYTNEQALKQILQNTGVTYIFIAPKEVSLKL